MFKLGLADLVLKEKSAKVKSSCAGGGSSSSSNSDTNTIAPGSPKTPTPLTVSLADELTAASKTSDDEKERKTESDSAAVNEVVRLKIARQLSDGYASSCTPLSASSLNSEQPTSNPFFQSTDSSSPSPSNVQPQPILSTPTTKPQPPPS